jgi:hypothetical protein
MDQTRNACNDFVGKSEGIRQLRRPRHRWEDNIRIDLWESVRRCELEASGSGQGPVVGFCEDDNEPSGSIKGGEFLN